MEFVEKYPEKPWNWDWISYNPNLTMEFVEQHPEKPWDWINISRNTFGLSKTFCSFESKELISNQQEVLSEFIGIDVCKEITYYFDLKF